MAERLPDAAIYEDEIEGPRLQLVESHARSRSKAFALAVIVTCQLMLILDGTVVNIALPHIQSGLHFSSTGLSWVVNAYALAFGGLLLLGGRVGDLIGRRRSFVIGIAVFTLASLTGGLAQDTTMILISRVIQGAGAAIAAPSSLSLIMSTYDEGAGRTRALAIFSAFQAAGGSLGLILGGVLTDWTSWRSIFFINVPVGIGIVLLAPRVINETEKLPSQFDLGGALTSIAGVSALVYGFIRASVDGWGNSLTVASFAAAIVLLAVFVAIERRVTQPIIPLGLFLDRNRAAAYANMLVVPAVLYGMFYFMSLFIQDVLGYSPVKAGVAFLPLTIGILALSQATPRLLVRIGAKPPMAAGAALVAAGLLWLTRISDQSGYVGSVFGPMLILGIGAGLMFTPLTVTILRAVRPEDSGSASGLLQTMQQVGGALGISILITRYTGASKHAANAAGGLTGSDLTRHVMAQGIRGAIELAVVFGVIGFLISALVLRTKNQATETTSPAPVVIH